MASAPRILISAGEASGDRLGAGLARALRARRPDIELLGMGGPQMESAGVRLVQQSSEVAVVGIIEVLSRLPAIRRAMQRLERCLLRERPDLLVPVDFPDFNLRLAARACRAGVQVVYFVSPQVWAWRRGRVRRIRRLVRRMLVLFPFEAVFYEQAGVPVSFVGHPATERPVTTESRERLCRRVGLDPARETVALLPGSRRGEIDRILPPMLGAAKLIGAERPSAQFLIPVAPGLDPALVAEHVARSGLTHVSLRAGDFPEILALCSAGAVASGTATLDAALMGLPLVVVYKMNPLSHAIGRMLVNVDHVALPNLVAGRRVVPELIQGHCTAEAIARELLLYLERPEQAERVRLELASVRQRLGGPGVFERAAEQVLAELQAARLPA